MYNNVCEEQVGGFLPRVFRQMVIDRFSRVALGGRGISWLHSFRSNIVFKKVGERGRLRSESFAFVVRCTLIKYGCLK